MKRVFVAALIVFAVVGGVYGLSSAQENQNPFYPAVGVPLLTVQGQHFTAYPAGGANWKLVEAGTAKERLFALQGFDNRTNGWRFTEPASGQQWAFLLSSTIRDGSDWKPSRAWLPSYVTGRRLHVGLTFSSNFGYYFPSSGARTGYFAVSAVIGIVFGLLVFALGDIIARRLLGARLAGQPQEAAPSEQAPKPEDEQSKPQ